MLNSINTLQITRFHKRRVSRILLGREDGRLKENLRLVLTNKKFTLSRAVARFIFVEGKLKQYKFINLKFSAKF